MKALVIGGGICGLTTAIGLHRAGITAEVYEAAPAFKPLGAGLVLGANAIKALDFLGLREAVVSKGHQLPMMRIVTDQGKELGSPLTGRLLQRFGSTFAIHRGELQEILLTQLQPDRVFTGKQLTSFDQTEKEVTAHFTDGTSTTADFLLATDGIHSVVRRQLIPESKSRYAGYTCWRGISPQPVEPIKFPSEVWGRGSRFGMVPLVGDRVYWYACLNGDQNDPALAKLSLQGLADRFAHYISPVAHLIQTADKLIHGDIIDMIPIKQFAFGRVLLMGDAAHATTPNLGQGACQAIEDAAILSSLLQSGMSISETFQHYQVKRLPRTTQVVNDSWRLGKIGQLEQNWAVTLRNLMMPLIPSRLQEKQLEFLYEVDF